MAVTSDLVKSEVCLEELLNWWIYENPPTKDGLFSIHPDIYDFIEMYPRYDSNKGNISRDAFNLIEQRYHQVMAEILRGNIPLYAHKIYEPWALYMEFYKKNTPKEIIYNGMVEGQDNILSNETLVEHCTIIHTNELIPTEKYDVWKKSYEQYEIQVRDYKEIPSFEDAKEEAIKMNGCYTYENVVMKTTDVQKAFYDISYFVNQIQRRATKNKKEYKLGSPMIKNRKKKVQQLALEYVKTHSGVQYTRAKLAEELSILLASEEEMDLKPSTIQSMIPPGCTKNSRGRPPSSKKPPK